MYRLGLCTYVNVYIFTLLSKFSFYFLVQMKNVVKCAVVTVMLMPMKDKQVVLATRKTGSK